MRLSITMLLAVQGPLVLVRLDIDSEVKVMGTSIWAEPRRDAVASILVMRIL
jgi:hypothetical protein